MRTVAVIASGPSLTKKLVDSVKHLPRICARRAIKMVPDAEVVLALDEYPNDGFWDEIRDYKGIKVCGKNDPRTGAVFIPFPAEIYQINGVTKFMFNNGIAAIRLAALSNPDQILLLGFDPDKPGTFYNPDERHGPNLEVYYEGLDIMLNNLIEELDTKGIKCIRMS